MLQSTIYSALKYAIYGVSAYVAVDCTFVLYEELYYNYISWRLYATDYKRRARSNRYGEVHHPDDYTYADITPAESRAIYGAAVGTIAAVCIYRAMM